MGLSPTPLLLVFEMSVFLSKDESRERRIGDNSNEGKADESVSSRVGLRISDGDLFTLGGEVGSTAPVSSNGTPEFVTPPVGGKV